MLCCGRFLVVQFLQQIWFVDHGLWGKQQLGNKLLTKEDFKKIFELTGERLRFVFLMGCSISEDYIEELTSEFSEVTFVWTDVEVGYQEKVFPDGHPKLPFIKHTDFLGDPDDPDDGARWKSKKGDGAIETHESHYPNGIRSGRH